MTSDGTERVQHFTPTHVGFTGRLLGGNAGQKYIWMRTFHTNTMGPPAFTIMT